MYNYTVFEIQLPANLPNKKKANLQFLALLFQNRYLPKGQTISKANYGFLNSPKKQTNLIILSKEHAQDT